MRSPKPVALPDMQGRRVRAFHGGFQVQGGSESATLNLYGAIGQGGITADAFRRALDSIRAPRITLRINSPGGDVIDGIAMYNDLIAHSAKVDVQVTGLAASAASIVAMAGDTVSMAESAFFVIHNAWVISGGDKRVKRKTADTLEQVDASLAGVYAARTGMPADEMLAMMDAETWFSAADAVSAGFADAVTGQQAGAMASLAFDLSDFGRVPAQVKRANEQGLRAAGLSRSEARRAAVTGFELPPADGDEEEGLRELQALARAFRQG